MSAARTCRGGPDAGRRAIFDAEQLGLEQRLDERRAVDRDEGAVVPRLARVDFAATSSLPAPLSPSISTVKFVSAMRASLARSSFINRLWPTSIALPPSAKDISTVMPIVQGGRVQDRPFDLAPAG